MKKRLCYNHQTILLFLMVLGTQVGQAQCELTDFDLEVSGGNCPNDGVIGLQYTGSMDCTGVQAILTIEGNPTPVVKNVPGDGNVEFDNLLSSPDQGYTLRLTLGSVERNFPRMTIPSTYIPMILDDQTTPPSCPGGTDGEITVSITGGGTGPDFIFELLDSSGGVIESSGETQDNTHTFSTGLEAGTYGYRVIDLGCNVNQRDQAIVPPNSATKSVYRNARFGRSSLDCSLYTVEFNITVFSAGGRAKVQEPGNATVSIDGGPPLNLTVKNIIGENVFFEYSPGLPGGVDFNLSFNDGCTTFSGGNTTLPIDDDLLDLDVRLGFDPSSCSSTHLVDAIGIVSKENSDPQPQDIYSMFRSRNEIIVEQETSPGVWEDITSTLGEGSNNPLSKGSFSSHFVLPGSGHYRISGKDDCHTTAPVEFDTKEETNPLDGILLRTARSVLGGTGAIDIRRISGQPFGSLIPETTYSIEPVPFQPSTTIEPTQPYTLAGSYTIAFPLEYTTTTNRSIIGDLPPGEYKMVVSDDCSRTNNSNVEKFFTISGNSTAEYNPIITVDSGCRNSNTIKYDMQATRNVANSRVPSLNNISVELWTADNSGLPGSLVSKDTNVSIGIQGSFEGLTPGGYLIRFRNINFQSTNRDEVHSAATGSNNDREFTSDVITIEEPRPIDVNTAGTFCDFSNAASGVILAQIPDTGSAPLVYPVTFELFNATLDGVAIGSAIAQNSIPNGPERSHVFQNLEEGNYVVVTSTGCGGNEVRARLSFSPISPKITPDKDMVCPGTEVTLTLEDVSPFIFDIVWKDDQGNTLNTDIGATTITVPVQQTTMYTVEYVAKDRLCSGTIPSTTTINITVPNTALEVTGDTVCEGKDATVTIADTEIGITYELLLGGNPLAPEIKGEGTGTDLVLNIPSLQLGAGTTTYTIGISGNGCAAAVLDETVDVVVNTLPTVTLSNPATCSLDLLTYALEVTVSAGTVESTFGNVSNTSGNTWSVTGVPEGTDITLRVTDTNGCVSTLDIGAPDCSCPVVDVPISGGNQSYCVGSAIPVLTAVVNPGETVDWYDAPTGGALLLAGGTSYTPAAPGNYYVEARNATNSCISTSRAQITLIENALPIVSFNDPADVCADAGTVDLTAFASPVGGTFTGTGVSGNSFDPAAAGTGTHDLTYVFTDGNGCTGSDTAVITVNALLVHIGTETTSCALDGRSYVLSVELNGTAPFIATGNGAPGAFRGNTWTSAPIPAGTAYNVNFRDTNGCNVVNVADAAPVCCVFEVDCPTFAATTVECYGDLPTATVLTEMEFEALGNGDGSIGDVPCGLIEITAANGPDTGNCGATVVRTYTVTEYGDTNGNGIRDLGEDTVLNSVACTQDITVRDTTDPVFVETLPADITVECNAVPAPETLTATDNCGTATVTFAETRTDGSCASDYSLERTWTATDVCGNEIVHAQTVTVRDTTDPVFVETLPVDITLECSAQLPVADILTATDNCGTATVAFAETRTDGSCASDYSLERTWTATDICGNETIHVQTITVTDTTPPIFVEALPQDGFASCDAIPTTAVLTATDQCGTVTVDFTETEVPGSCSSEYFLARTWTTTDDCGNEASHTQTLQLTCPLKVYNAVSANSDGRNDGFKLEGIDCFPNNNVKIFNRWGVKVFETNGYDNRDKVFQGFSDGRLTIARDEKLPSGTYFYVIQYTSEGNQETTRQSGFLYLSSDN